MRVSNIRIKQQGITLIELLLAMVITVLILVAVGLYYESTRSAQRVNQGVRVINMITAGAEHWFMTYKTFQTPTFDIDAMADQGLLPSNFKTANADDPNPNNPWRGSIDVSPVGSSTNQITVKLNGLNQPDCLSLCDIMNKAGVTSDCAACTPAAGKSSIYSGTYSAVPNK